MNRQQKQHTISLIETIIVIGAIFVAITLFLPSFVVKHSESTGNMVYALDYESQQNDYADFWKIYDNVIKNRGDLNHDGAISIDEEKAFSTQFFDRIQVTISNDGNLKNSDGSESNTDSLICNIKNYYPDKPWVRPACPAL